MNKKFKFLHKKTNLLDLGSFPGGWSQVACEKISEGKILAIDTKLMEKIDRVEFMQGDLLDSNIEIKTHLYKLYILPIYVSIMAIIGSILMLYLNYFNSKLSNISIGIITSVIIYYINHFFNLLGTAEKTSVLLSVSVPLIILAMFCFIGIVKINEK